MLSNHPHLVFYGQFLLLAVLTVISAVTWNQWYIRRAIVKEFRKQLRIKLHGEDTMTVYRPNWGKK